jgi:hypothetical protein
MIIRVARSSCPPARGLHRRQPHIPEVVNGALAQQLLILNPPVNYGWFRARQCERCPLNWDDGSSLRSHRPIREDTSQVRLAHTVARTSVAFDDPNLVPRAGLVMAGRPGPGCTTWPQSTSARPATAGRTRTSRSAAWPPDVTQRVKTEEARDAMFTYE